VNVVSDLLSLYYFSFSTLAAYMANKVVYIAYNCKASNALCK